MSRYLLCVFVFYDHSITADTNCILCVLSIPENTLYIFMENNIAEKYVIPSDGEVCL
jgi:hypothetical protein